MPQQFNAASHCWEIRLDDGSTVAAPGYHYSQPFIANGFLFCAKASPGSNDAVARKLSTGQEFINPLGGGWQTWATDGRYVIGAKRVHQGKQFFHRDLVAYIFDTQQEKWLDFAALGRSVLDIFHDASGTAHNLGLWVHNGNQSSLYTNTNPRGIVLPKRPKFITPTLIDYVIDQRSGNTYDPAGVTIGLLHLQREIVLATGYMGPITVVP